MGRACGDLVHPMPFTPELHSNEFSSAVADMKNSVAVCIQLLYHDTGRLKKSQLWITYLFKLSVVEYVYNEHSRKLPC